MSIQKSKSEKPTSDKPYPVKLGEAKPKLQQMALTRDWSLHKLIKKTMTFVADGKIILPF